MRHAQRPPPALPPQLVARARAGERMLEVGAGKDWSTASGLADLGAVVVVTDVDPEVLLAPPRLRALVLDVTRPDVDLVGAADLVYAVRVPEELQLACARLADALGADLALRPLKDEWADLGPRRYHVWPEGWRFFGGGAAPPPPPSPRDRDTYR